MEKHVSKDTELGWPYTATSHDMALQSSTGYFVTLNRYLMDSPAAADYKEDAVLSSCVERVLQWSNTFLDLN